jgi:crossover junction endodeoxyribonuclease RuvC
VKRNLILGVDPGYTGALCLIDPGAGGAGRIVTMKDMPLAQVKERNEIDVGELNRWVDFHSREIRFAVIEKVGPRPGESPDRVFRFGYGAGVIHGICAGNWTSVFFVQPAVWKSLMNVTSDKDTSLELARKSFPDDEQLFRRQKDHGRAEAALLAKFGAERLLK